MSAYTQESVVIDICTVPAGRQQAMIDRLLASLEALRLIDGFIEAGALPNREGTKVVWYLRMRSAEDWNRAADSAEVRERIRTLESISDSHIDVVERAWVIVAPTEQGVTEVSYGSF
jgi:heme-degrading monooxygenase HmoA